MDPVRRIPEIHGRRSFNPADGRKRLHWVTIIGGIEKTFDTKITEQIPDKRIAWRSLSGAPNAGVVTFHPLSAETARIMLQMEYEPEGLLENAGDMLGIASHRVNADLERFKVFIEARGAETGAWRGKVEHQE